MSNEEPSTPVDGWTDVGEQSPVSCQSGVDIKDDVSSEKQDGGVLDNIMKNQECHSANHSHSPPDSPSDNRAHVLLENQSLNDINLGDDKLIAERRECLLLEQQRELDELKKKHKQIASDLLKELPLETHKRIVSACDVEIPAYTSHSGEDVRGCSTSVVGGAES